MVIVRGFLRAGQHPILPVMTLRRACGQIMIAEAAPMAADPRRWHSGGQGGLHLLPLIASSTFSKSRMRGPRANQGMSASRAAAYLPLNR